MKIPRIKEELGSDVPLIQLTFLMMKENYHELPKILRIAEKAKIPTVVSKNWDVIHQKEDLDKIMYSVSDQHRLDSELEYRRDLILEESKDIARDLGIQFVTYPFNPNEENYCWTEPLTSLYITLDGDVSICCMLAHPVPRVVAGQQISILLDTKRTIGNLNYQSLSEILNSDRYLESRQYLERNELPPECHGCLMMKEKPSVH